MLEFLVLLGVAFIVGGCIAWRVKFYKKHPNEEKPQN